MNDFLNHFKNNKRDLINLIFLIILVISLPFAFKLAKERQLFSPKATNNAIEVVIPATGSDIQRIDDQTIKTSNPNIQLNITSPLEEGGQSFNPFNLVGTVYAAPGDDYDLGELLISPPIDPDAGNCSEDKTILLVTNDATKNVNCTDKSKTKNKDAVCAFKNNVFGCYEKLPKAAPVTKLHNTAPADAASRTLKADSDSIQFAWDGGDPKITKYKFILYRGTYQNYISGGQVKHNSCGSDPTNSNLNQALLYCEWNITTKNFTLKKADFDQDSNEKVYTWYIQGFDAGNTLVQGSSGNTIKVKVGDSAAPAASATGICKNDTDCVDGNACTQDICINKKCAHSDVGMGSACAFESTPPYSKAVKWCNTDAECKLTTDPSGTGAGSDSGAKNAGGSTPQTAEAISIACRNRAVNDPNWCLGYPIQCEGTGVTWYYGGKKVRDANGNTKCEFNNAWTCGAFKLNSDGSPASTLGCTKPWPPAPGTGGQNGGANTTPSKPSGGQGGPVSPQGGAPAAPAPVRPAPGEGDNDKVTLCGTEMSMAQARSAVGLSGGDRATVSDSYLKKFCPGSQNNCKLVPDWPEVTDPAVTPNGYIWVANCNRACLRNNSNGNSKDVLIDPNPNDLAACPKNYNDFSVNPRTSNWCYGFEGTGENTNRCMVLWTKAKYEQLKNTPAALFDLGSGTPGGNTGGAPVTSTAPTGTWAPPVCDSSPSNFNKFSGCSFAGATRCTNYGAAGVVRWTAPLWAKCNSICSKPEASWDTACTDGTLPPAVDGRDDKICAQVITYATNPATGECKTFPNSCITAGWTTVSSCPTGSGAWIKASCVNNKFDGCKGAGAEICKDWGLNTAIYTSSGWTKAEYDKCSNACAKYGTAKNDVEACKALGVTAPPAGTGTKQTISGTATYANCSHGVFPGAQILVRDEITGAEVNVYTGPDGKYTVNNIVSKGNRYVVSATANTNTGVLITKVETSDPSSASYKNQKDGTGSNCGAACDFKLTAQSCAVTPQRAVRTVQATTAQYLLTENRNDFTNLAIQWTNYPLGGIKNLSYAINGVGQHTLFLKFKDSEGNIIDNNGTPYTFYVELLAPAGSPAQVRVMTPDAPDCSTTDRSCCPATPVSCASQNECSGKYNWCYAGVCIDGNYKENDSNPGKGLGSCTAQGVGSTAPNGGSGQPASCKTTTVCGQTVTGNSSSDCKFSCDANGNAKYDCTQSDNGNCIGTVYCGGENYKCNGGGETTACNATETVCGQKVYDHYTLRCTNGQAFYDSYQTNNKDNCIGSIQCSTDDYKCEGI